MKRFLGISLIELLVCLALLALLTTAIFPYFSFKTSKQLEVMRDQLVQSIYFSKTEAIKRRTRITLCHSLEGAKCSGNWSDGLLVLHDTQPLQFFKNTAPQSVRCFNKNSHHALLFNTLGNPHTPKNTTFECYTKKNRLVLTLTRAGKVKSTIY
jgi:Tfp pilus assembly protein FimT